MSFEAVPCMFKQRQEDGAEVGLFGLLIRPSPSASSNLMPSVEGQKQEQPTPSSSSASPTADHPSPITALSTLAGPSSVQIVPGDAKKNDHQNLNSKRTQQRPIAFLGPQTVQRRPGGPFPLLAPPGMPPILPRPKKGAQRGTMPILGMGTGTKVIVPITTSAAMCKMDNAAQSPSQVVPQIGAIGGPVDVLSIATTSSASTSSASSISPGSNNSPPLAAIPSPPAAKREKGGKKQQKRTTKTEGKGQGGKSTSANSKRRRPQKEKGARGSADQQQNAPLEGTGGMLGEDLHSIEFSQLVNSTVITTEDYLPSQSEPIYTNLDNLDMYNPGHGPPCPPHQQSHPNALRPLPHSLSNHHFNDPAISVPPAPVPGHHPQPPPQLCSSAIYLHNQQHFPCPSHSSQVRFVGPPNGQIPYAPPSSGQSSAPHSQSNGANQPSWHPYLVAHPGCSHISSTPDSGIQSIDGSPPSVYTPPMVSPYASQVRSCESVGANGHCSSNAGSLLNAHPPPQVTAYSLPHSTAQMNGMCQGETTLLLMSTNGNGHLAAHSSMQMPPIQQQLAPPPPRLIGHGMRENQQGGGIDHGEGRGNGAEEGEEEDGPDDFSDMPKLVPVTHLDHEEAMIEGEGGRGEEQKAALAEEEQGANGQSTGESAESPSKSATPNAGEVFFNAEMNLQELAECLSSRMPPEQLKQLTSLIQSKAANCANKNSPLVEHIGGGGEKSAGKLGAEKKQQKRKEKKGNNCEVQGKKGSSKLAAEKAKKKEKMVTSSKKPAELKTKCENLDAKVHSKERPPAKWTMKEKEEEEKEGIAQVIEHRRQVKMQLGRKLEEFTEKVRQQIERTNLNIRNEYWPEKGKKILALRRMDWEEVEKRMERKEKEGKEQKRRGRKRREENGKREIGIRRRKEGGNLNEEERMKAGRKRRAGGGEECPREGGKKARMSRQKAEEKQRTPPIILKLPNLLNRKKNHPSIRPPAPSNDAIMGACKPQKQMESKASTSCPADNCIQQNRKEMPPSPPPLFAHQLAIIRAGHWFLPRNLKRKEIGGMRRERRGTNEGDSIELAKLLAQIFDDFGEICRQKGVPKRHLHHFQRTLGMLFHSESSPSAALLLDRFDGLVKQMISSLKIANLRMAYLQLKRSANFGLVHPQLQKDHLQMFTEDRRRSLHPLHQSPSSPSKRLDSALITQRPLTVDTNLDLSYMDSEHPVGRWDPDKEAKLSPNSDNRDHDCVRCICGMAEDDGVMTQCDGCHFWLHADCLDNPVNEDQEYICDFCKRRLETTPRVDIVLRPQPSIKFSGCTYFRTLVNSRGLQIRLNEAIYVERLINDKHKRILRELHEECVRKQQPPQTSPIQSPLKNGKGGGRKWTIEGERAENGERRANEWWTEEAEARADRNEFHRRDLRVFRVERLFISPNGQRFIFGCYYARPHETFCDSSRMFYRNELFWTPLFDTLPLDSVVGRCLILEPQIWATGRPKSPRYLEEDVYCCEYQIDRNQRSFEKIQPKNRYYINTEPYVFNTFPEKLAMKRDFTPFQMGGNEAEGPNGVQNNSPQKQQSTTISALAVRKRLHQENLEMVCKRIGQKRGKRKENEKN